MYFTLPNDNRKHWRFLNSKNNSSACLFENKHFSKISLSESSSLSLSLNSVHPLLKEHIRNEQVEKRYKNLPPSYFRIHRINWELS